MTKFKRRVRVITKRNRGISFEDMLCELNLYTRGWMGYFGLDTSDSQFKELDQWIRRRVRQYQFKLWKRKPNRYRELKALCPLNMRCPGGSVSAEWDIRCKGASKHDSYWRGSNSQAVKQGMSNRWLSERGMFFLVDGWNERHREGAPTAGCEGACPVV